jgi:uncharacterized protein YdeI (YjbR/CyaY-like superfamily)
MDPIFFASPAAFRAWLEKHHASEREVLVGFHKKATGKPTMTWSESVDEALCFGWIDGVRRGAGADAYTIRFTPRKPASTWSKVNVAKVEALTKAGRMRPAGVAAFERRTAERTGIYSFESENHGLGAYEAELRANKKAWAWFEKQPPGYQRTAAHWVTSAKKEETRRSRLATLIADAAAGRKIKPLRRPGEGTA